MTAPPDIRAAAVVYRRGTHDRQALTDFARSLQAEGRRVGGMVQEAFSDAHGLRLRIDSVDLATGDRVAINKPNLDPLKNGGCSLDRDALMDSGLPPAAARTSSRTIIEGAPPENHLTSA